MDLGDELRRAGDELRVLAEIGLSFAADQPYDRERYEHARRIASRLFAWADKRPAEEIERTVFRELTHIAPIPAVDAAVMNDARQIFLVRRSDDRLWATPGGGIDMGETPAQTAEREAREEGGLVVRARELVGVWDSRFCGTKSALQLYQFVFLCDVVGKAVEPSTPGEVIDAGWFAETQLPPLSPGHTTRVPLVFEYLRTRRCFFDENRSRHTSSQAASQDESSPTSR